jgi:hypothetical protein
VILVKKHKILLIIFSLFVSARCTKTKIGDYKLIIDGTIYTREGISLPTVQTSTNTTLPYHTERDVKITDVSNSLIVINGDFWEKSGKTINFKTMFDSNSYPSHALGSQNTYTSNYYGNLISNHLIEGDYYYESHFYAWISGNYSSSTVTAKFTITKK